MALTPRGRALRWLTNHRGITEQPAGSNRDNRKDGITAAQKRCAGGADWLIGQPWCGVWAYNALRAGRVKGISSRLASVALIEQDAKRSRGPFRGWTTNPRDPRRVLRGDLVVLFGYGVHVGVVRKVYPRLGLIRTEEGNTSSGNAGSQNEGGGSYPRWRRLSDVRGFALVDYPNR